MVQNNKVVTLCGNTHFKDQFIDLKELRFNINRYIELLDQ